MLRPVRGEWLFRSVVVAAAALGTLPACDRVEALMQKPFARSPRTAQSAASAGPSADPGDAGAPPAMPLDPKVRRGMRLSPLRRHEPGVAIGKGRIAVLARDALVVRDSSKFEEVARVPLHRPRALAVLADGSFLVADDVHTVWLLPHDTKPRKFQRITLLPRSALFPDRQTPERFWVLPGSGKTLFSYTLQQSELSILLANAFVDLDDFDSQALGSLRDGSFLYTTPSGFRQFYGPLKKDDIAGSSQGVVRILPGSRPDTVWLVTADQVTLCRLLAGKLIRLRSIALGEMPYDVDADGAYLAVLELAQPTDAPWNFLLEVFDIDGKRHVREPLSAEESFDGKTWLSTLTRNRRFSLSAEPPLVAIGGPDSLTVLRADDGARLTQP
jgi:hypothetical protein